MSKRKVNVLLIGVVIVAFAISIGYLQLRNATTAIFLPTTILNDDGIQENPRNSVQISDFQLVLSTPESFVFRFTEPASQSKSSLVSAYAMYAVENPTNATPDSAQLLSSSITPTGQGKVFEFSVPRSPGSSQDVAFFLRGNTSSNAQIDSNTVFVLSFATSTEVSVISQQGVAQFVASKSFFNSGCSLAGVKQNRVYMDTNGDSIIQDNELREFLIGSDIEGDAFCASQN